MTLQRTYANSNSMDSNYFVGTEVERTEQYGKLTLFVRGYQPYEAVIAKAREVGAEHVYFGADHSYQGGTQSEQLLWQMLMRNTMAAGYPVTMDIPQSRAYDIVGSTLLDNPLFHLQIYVAMPHIEKYNSRTYIKFDDQQFNSTNSGIWSVPVSTITCHTQFTPWSAYSADRVV